MTLCNDCGEREKVWGGGYCNECYKKRQKKWRRENYHVITEETRHLFPNQGKRWTKEDKYYLCAFYEDIDKRDLALSLGRTIASMQMQYLTLKKGNWVERYKERYWNGEESYEEGAKAVR